MTIDPVLLNLFGGLAGVLAVASVAGVVISKRAKTDAARATASNYNARVAAWWVMVILVGVAVALSRIGITVLFGLISFLALREFLTLTPTKRADHRSLFWAFFVILPMNYILLGVEWYGFWSIFIPVFGFLFIPLRAALRSDPERFLERTAEIQWGLMICVYCISHAPALLLLKIPGYEHSNSILLLYLLIVVQMSDVMQYVWGKSFGRHKIAPVISPSKTWEGFVGGILSATAVGAALWFVTPFAMVQSAILSLVITMMGFAGGLVMSAIKRGLGVKDYGELIPGHGGVLDRLDSVSFAAPVFFHVVRYYYES